MAKIKIEKDLHQRAERCAQDKGYSSVQEFVTHLLERALMDHQEQEQKDQEAVEQRLRGMGYLE